MSTTIAPEELLERATMLAKTDRNMDIMDRTTILHGYVELTRLDPNNDVYRKNVEEAAARLMKAAELSLSLRERVPQSGG